MFLLICEEFVPVSGAVGDILHGGCQLGVVPITEVVVGAVVDGALFVGLGC